MTEQSILGLLAEAENNMSETTSVEFKDARGGFSGNGCWKSISSFSHNPEGGIIVFGAAEKSEGEIEYFGVGDRGALIQENMVSYCRDDMVGCMDPVFHHIEYKGVPLLVCEIKHTPDESKPCYRKNKGVPNGACIRIGNVDKVLTDLEAREFMRNSTPFKYDHMAAEDVTVEDLSTDKITAFLQRSAERTGRSASGMSQVGSLRATMRNMGIVDNFDGVTLPTRAGFLLFSSQPPQAKKEFSRYVIRCIHYKGLTPASPIVDSLDIAGTLDEQIEGMQAFVLKNIALEVEIVGTKRVERYEYPPDALREVVANAVIHRDYNTVETYTQISIFSNRIEIVNAGNLPPGVTVDNIKESQFSRNLTMAAILKDMDYMEEYGRGVDIVFSSMSDYGLMDPVFKNSSNTFKVILLGNAFKDLNKRQIEVWHLLQSSDKTVTTSECCLIFEGVSKSTISSDLNNMVELDLIEKVGKGPSTHYKAIH
ncbi:MAG: ATP-dependent DNA helicase RecG [Patiriisocius sp.]|jgi:ATP-dependent DNA helicase RecG